MRERTTSCGYVAVEATILLAADVKTSSDLQTDGIPFYKNHTENKSDYVLLNQKCKLTR